MKKLFILMAAIALSVASSDAQSIWSRRHLDSVKSQLHRPVYSSAYNALVREADSLLDAVPLSVMMKEKPSPSGDNHDYTSLARYFHPDPEKPDGLPYVNRDGVTNPEINLYDRNRLGETAARIATLALAWHLSGDEKYAEKATQLLKVWFLDPETRMNPNFEYAQIVPGVNGNKGRSYGVLDGYSFVEMLDGVELLKGSKSWTKKDDKELKKWMGSLLEWMLTSPQGKEEAQAANNHSTAYDAQIIALALYTGREDLARKIINEVPARRIFTQINPDGRQPHEMGRTRSFHYSHYNLTHLIDIFLMAQKLGINVDKATDAEGRNFYKAMDFLASFLGKDAGEWPGTQLDGWENTQQDVACDLWRIGSQIDTTRSDYRQLYQTHRIFNPADRFNLLYYQPDEIDDAFCQSASQLKYAIGRVREERNKEANAAKRRVSPRSIDPEGNITLVHPHDWTSGFFPGELWLMYEFTNDPYWREEAVAFTWPIEEAKMHSGTHDLGFMIGDSFGKAWELTGERSYFDVVHQAAKTLTTRFNPNVGAIRSWDHNAQTWKYPVIIDNMMNLEMLFKMSDATGNPLFRDIAVSHANVTLKNHFRPDHSSYHVVDYDPTTGEVRMKVTAQGYADDSFWSRGQGWGLYGYTMCYRYTKDPVYLNHAKGIADWFLSLTNMPEDMVPYWDMKAPGTEVADNPEIPRDASAAALIASGLYELSEYVDDADAEKYRGYADRILDTLTEHYSIRPGEGEGFLLAHSTGHLPAGGEIDVPLVYADYYYLEALLRKRNKSEGSYDGCSNNGNKPIKGYPGDYAKRPRFNALIYYGETAEPAHVDFANQAIDFFHHLSYGEGFTYKVVTTLANDIDSLSNFDMIISINVMPGAGNERKAFEEYMENGGGWMGFHAAAYNDANTHWEWFNKFLGAGTFYCNTWPPQPALMEVCGNDLHPVTRNLPSSFVAPACEWYQWQNPSPSENPDVEVLLTLSDKNYPIGIKDIISFGDFPIVWSNRNYRMIYLNIGHGDVEFTDATQNLLLVNAFRWIASRSPKGDPFLPQD